MIPRRELRCGWQCLAQEAAMCYDDACCAAAALHDRSVFLPSGSGGATARLICVLRGDGEAQQENRCINVRRWSSALEHQARTSRKGEMT